MPRTSERAYVLESIDDAIESTACCSILVEDGGDNNAEDDIEDLMDIREIIGSHRYLSHDMNAGRHASNTLEDYIHQFSEKTFLEFFRMHRASFWQLVDVLTQAGGEKYWDYRTTTHGRKPRPIYQQIAVALYMLGGGGGTGERSRANLNIGHGTLWVYTWRTAKLLYKLVPEYIRWPPRQLGCEGEGGGEGGHGRSSHRIFQRCIGFLDGTNIILRYKPMIDPEAYFSRKKIYGFNLQAICNWKGQFIWVAMGHTASVHDSTASKSTALYQALETYFDPEEYILADKAYALERHIITPFKEPASRQPANAAFNTELSRPRVKIEHAFGVLKACWSTIYEIPVRIDSYLKKGHERVHQ